MKTHRILLSLVLTVIIGVAAFVGWSFVLSIEATGILSVTPTSLSPIDVVTVSGTGFPSNTWTWIYVDTQSYGPPCGVATSASGSFGPCPFSPGGGFSLGSHTISIKDQSTGMLLSNVVTITVSVSYTVTFYVQPEDAGSVRVGGVYMSNGESRSGMSGNYPLYIVPSTGYAWADNWVSGGVTASANTSPTESYSGTLTVSGNGELTTYFESSTVSNWLFVSAGSGGSVSGTVSGSYSAGVAVSVTAVASSGYSFAGWTISGASCSGGVSANPCTFAMPSNAVTLTATFVLIDVQSCPVDGVFTINDIRLSSGNLAIPSPLTFKFQASLSAETIQSVVVTYSGTQSGSLPLIQSASTEWQGTADLSLGTYSVQVTVTCNNGSTRPILSLIITIDGSESNAWSLPLGVLILISVIAGAVLWKRRR